MKNHMKNTAAFSPFVFVVPRYVAVRAQRKISETVTPVAPTSKNVRRPNRSMKKAVQILPTMVKVVQHAFNNRGIDPESPREAYISTP